MREEAADLGVALEGEHDRQRRIAVAQVDAARLAGLGGMSLDVEQVVSHLERQPDVLAARRHGLDDGRRRAGEVGRGARADREERRRSCAG